MCAISGAIALTPQLALSDSLLKVVEKMAQSMHHRGPDFSRIEKCDNHLVANNRLTIQDRSEAAHMPMWSEDHQILLTFNGEISNFHELRINFKLDEIHQFKTHSDTEVLLAMYKKMGIDFLKHLTGMFSLCLIDRKAHKAFLIRDYFGITPLFYTIKDERLFFASEIKGLLPIPSLSKELNQESFFHLLTLGYMPRDFTPYQSIHELQNGELIEVDYLQGSYQKKRYYQIPSPKINSISFKQASKDVEELIINSVKRHLISDSPLGITLSGGIDSSSFAGVMKKLGLSQGVSSFGIEVQESSFNERKYQDLMSAYVGTNHQVISIGAKEVIGALHEHIKYIDEPYAHGAAIPTFLLAKKAKESVRVLLSGEGGDEIFNAYDTHAAYKIKKWVNSVCPSQILSMFSQLAKLLPTNHSKLSFDFKLKRFLAGAQMDIPTAHIFWRHLATDQLKRRLQPGMCDAPPTSTLIKTFYDQLEDMPALDKLTRTDLNFFTIGDLMVKNDRMLMAHSIEGRFPYLDRELVEYVSTLPSEIRFPLYRRRLLQKESLKNILPAEILERKSFGLELPYSKWLITDWAQLSEESFHPRNSWRFPFWDWNEIHRIWLEHKNRKVDHGRLLWGILIAITWHGHFIE